MVLRINKSVYCTVRNFSYASGWELISLVATDTVNFYKAIGSIEKPFLGKEVRAEGEVFNLDPSNKKEALLLFFVPRLRWVLTHFIHPLS